jgi:hypothetical protein
MNMCCVQIQPEGGKSVYTFGKKIHVDPTTIQVTLGNVAKPEPLRIGAETFAYVAQQTEFVCRPQ